MYDLTIAEPKDWANLKEHDLNVIVDPFIYRIGQKFLQGKQANGNDLDTQWHIIEHDLGALVSFIDLVVLNDQLPAFNYTDTFDVGLNFDQSLGHIVNNEGDKTLVSVDVQYQAYMNTKAAAMDQLRGRVKNGQITEVATQEIIASLDVLEYEWEPSLQGLEHELRDINQVRVAQFIGGILVFAGYAQQTGAPHILAPRRSQLVSGIGINDINIQSSKEINVYDEIRRRIRDAGSGWRKTEFPWTPSFLPYLLKQMNHYKEGPDMLLKRAKDLRESRSIRRYRDLLKSINSEDIGQSADAIKELQAITDEMSKALDSDRKELELTKKISIEILPEALGIVGGAAVAGPAGAVAGGIAGLVAKEVLKSTNSRLWGWILDKLPLVSAKKLLTRSLKAEYELRDELGKKLRTVWETGS